MAEPKPIDHETWLEYLGPAGVQAWCGLCGNFGIVDTRGSVRSPDGKECGVRAFCICPNGRLFKHKLGGVLPHDHSHEKKDVT